MNHLDKIYGFKPLEVDAVYELVKDMCNEDESFNPRKSKYRTAMAMFLRRYCYLPMKLISDATHYFEARNMGKTVVSVWETSLDSDIYDMMECYRHIAETYYGVNSFFIDRGSYPSALEDAMLYKASRNIPHKMRDINGLSNYKLTPSVAPPMYCLANVIHDYNSKVSVLDILDKYNIYERTD